MIPSLAAKPRQLFGLDAAGAVGSSLALLFLVGRHEDWFGLPASSAELLGLLALVLVFLSSGCAMLGPTRWQGWLRLVASLNLSYLAVSAFVIMSARQPLTLLGNLYFGGEFLIVAVLAGLELRVAGYRPKSS